MPTASPPHEPLRRQLRLPTATLLVVTNMVGAGVFLMPGEVASQVAEPLAYFGAWLLGAVLALSGAASYGELGARFPQAGGEYVYLHRSFGPFLAFVAGWLSFFVAFAGSQAMLAEGLARGLLEIVVAAPDGAIRPVADGFVDALAAALLFVFAAVNCVGLRPSGWLQATLGCATFTGIALLVTLGLSSDAGDLPAHLGASAPAVTPTTPPLWMGLLMAQIPIFFAYSGWNVTTYLGAEVVQPQRVIPRSLLLGTALVAGVYLALNLVFVHAFPLSRMAGQKAVGFQACAQLLSGPARVLPQILMAVAMAGALNAVSLAGPRVAYAMARDDLFPRPFATLHARFGTPAHAVMLQAGAALVLLLTGTFDDLTRVTSSTMMLISGLTVAALIRLRARGEGAAAAYRTPLYPVPALLYLAMTLAVVAVTVYEDWRRVATGLVVALTALPAYALLRRTRKQQP